MGPRTLLFLCLASSLAAGPGAGSPRYTAVDTGITIEDGYHAPLSLNNRGQIAGATGAAGYRGRGFVWTRGRLRTLPTLGGPSSGAVDIDDSGAVVGWADTPEVVDPPPDSNAAPWHVSHACLWRDGRMVDLNPPGADRSRATRLAPGGRIAGWWRGGGPYDRAFVWQSGRTKDIGRFQPVAFTRGGTILGSGVLYPPGWRRSFLWRAGRTTDLGLFRRGDFVDMNAAGTMVGSALFREREYDRPCAARGRRITWLAGLPRRSAGRAFAINERGAIVGLLHDRQVTPRAVLWERGRAVDLNAVVRLPAGWRLEMARAVNDRGQIVCLARKDFRRWQWRAFLLTPAAR